jgi:hypothetical protein
MPKARPTRWQTVLVVAFVTSLMAAPVKSATPRDVDVAEGPIIPTSIEGRSMAAWAADAMAIALQQQDQVNACQQDATGRVVLLVRAGSDCIVTDGQMIFVPIVAQACSFDDRLRQRAERIAGERQDRLWSRINAQEAAMFRCLFVDHDALGRAFLSVDGSEAAVDGSLFSVSDPVSVDGVTYRWPGYYAMVEPLPPGQHVIVTGHEAIPGSPLRMSTTIDVVETT